MSRYYRLDGRTPVPCDLETYALNLTDAQRRVRLDTVGPMTVSTVFLGLDHNYGPEGPPLLFETMVFGPAFDQMYWRCATYLQAEEMHDTVLAVVHKHHEQAEQLTAELVRELRMGGQGSS